MLKALQLHELKKAVVVPIVLREVAFLEKTPFGKLQMLPKDAKPIVQWERSEQVWAEVAQALGNICADLQQRVERTEDEVEARLILEKIAADMKCQEVERRKILDEMPNIFSKLPPGGFPGMKTAQDAKRLFDKMDAYINSKSEPPLENGNKKNT